MKKEFSDPFLNRSEHIALFIPSLRGGGAERVWLKLSNGFAERGNKVDLIAAKAEGPYLKYISPKVRLIDLNASRVLLSLIPLATYLLTAKPSILISAMNHSNIVALLAKYLTFTSIPVIVSVRNHFSTQYLNLSGVDNNLIPVLARLLYPHADGIIAVSKGVSEDLSEALSLSQKSIQTIYNPIVTPDLYQKSQSTLRHPLLSSSNSPFILSVGRLTKQKDFPTLIEAFSKVRHKFDIHLVILGEGEERYSLKKMLKEMNLTNFVHLPGFAENPYLFMAHSKAFVLSSRWEGLPGVLIEAMAIGTPVVSTNCKSGPDEILENGKYGHLVPVGDSDKLAKAIIQTLDNPLSKITLKKRASDFSEEKIIDQYLSYIYGHI